MPVAVSPPTARGMLNRVPEVTAAFSAIKVTGTAVGETGADHLAIRVGL